MAGFVRELKAKAGDEVKVGAVVCVLDDTKVLTVKMAAAKGGEALKEGQKATLSVGGKKVDVKVEKIINGEARGTIENPKNELKPGEKGTLTVEKAGPRTALRDARGVAARPPYPVRGGPPRSRPNPLPCRCIR